MKIAQKIPLFVGDFNYLSINWDSMSSTKESIDFRDVCLDKFLSQVVTKPTRDTNILDIVLTNNDNMVTGVKTIAPLGNSDHNIVVFLSQWKAENYTN